MSDRTSSLESRLRTYAESSNDEEIMLEAADTIEGLRARLLKYGESA